MKLYVTAPAASVEPVLGALRSQDRAFVLFETDNRGRDIGPFLGILPSVLAEGCTAILKLHTKKSRHVKNGDAWADDLLASLLAGDMPGRALGHFVCMPGLGILAPDGHVLSVSEFIGANDAVVGRLCNALRIDRNLVNSSCFVAGSMFYARPDLFRPLIEAGLSASDFENEAGQIDGTLAHGIERMAGALAARAGLVVSTVSAPSEAAEALRAGTYRYLERD